MLLIYIFTQLGAFMCMHVCTFNDAINRVFYDNLRLSAIDALADADMSLSLSLGESLLVLRHFYDAHPAWQQRCNS